LRQLHFRAERVQIRRARFALDPPIEKIARRHDAFFKFLPAALAHHRVRIFAGRHLGHADDEIVLEQRVQRTFCRLLSRRVRVETENHFTDEALQDPRRA
jgi:hypothetical protein